MQLAAKRARLFLTLFLVTGTFTNGQSRVLAQLAVAKFEAADQLERLDGNLYGTTNGTGDYSLAGAPTGYQAFSTLSASTFTEYYAEDGINWESGIGQVLTGPARLSRIAIFESSNAGAAVDSSDMARPWITFVP